MATYSNIHIVGEAVSAEVLQRDTGDPSIRLGVGPSLLNHNITISGKQLTLDEMDAICTIINTAKARYEADGND